MAGRIVRRIRKGHAAAAVLQGRVADLVQVESLGKLLQPQGKARDRSWALERKALQEEVERGRYRERILATNVEAESGGL